MVNKLPERYMGILCIACTRSKSYNCTGTAKRGKEKRERGEKGGVHSKYIAVHREEGKGEGVVHAFLHSHLLYSLL